MVDGKLTIKGKLPGDGASKEDVHALLCEREPLTSFDRSFQLPDDVNAAKITAKLVRQPLATSGLEPAAGKSWCRRFWRLDQLDLVDHRCVWPNAALPVNSSI